MTVKTKLIDKSMMVTVLYGLEKWMTTTKVHKLWTMA